MSDDQPFTPLGWAPGRQGKPGRRYVFQVGDELISIPASVMMTERLLQLVPDRLWWEKRFPWAGERRAHGVKWRLAGAALIKACRDVGRYRGGK